MKSTARGLTAEESAFVQTLFLHNRVLITRVITNALGETFAYLCEDCVSETCLTACKKVTELIDSENPDAELVLMAKNTALRMMKSHLKDLQSVPYEDASELAVSDNMLEDAVFFEWMEKKVPRRLLAELSEQERKLYELLYIQHCSAKITANTLGIKECTVRTMKKTIVDKITKALRKNQY